MAKAKNTHVHVAILSVAAFLLVVAALAYKTQQSQALPGGTAWKKEVNPTQCDKNGAPVINVTQKVMGSVDSGQAGNYWAYDDYNRQIQVWKQTDNTFCALVNYEGKFDSQAGQTSPGKTGPLTGNEDGTFKGGYRGLITGAMKDVPDLATKGSIGTVDYNCDLHANCPGAYNWMDKYFATSATGFSFNYQWWGWEYKYKNKVWVNASTGNSGDIL